MEASKVIIVPDVHGRTFWKDGKTNVYNTESELVIFLGDYLDPYEKDRNRAEIISNFEEIIDFAYNNKEKTVLLLGNHDLQYMHHLMLAGRKDTTNEGIIKDLFVKNYELFKILYALNIDNTDILFSHAPVLPGWIDICNRVITGILPNDMHELVKCLNSLWLAANNDNFPRIYGLLSFCSTIRGGLDKYGSPVWADINETQQIEGWYQIFGHTQLDSDDGYVSEKFACLDSRRCFTLDEIMQRCKVTG